MVDVARFFMEFCRDESCGKCIPCRAGTVQMHDLLDKITEGEADRSTTSPCSRSCAPLVKRHQPVRPRPDRAQPGAEHAALLPRRVHGPHRREALPGRRLHHGRRGRRGRANGARRERQDPHHRTASWSARGEDQTILDVGRRARHPHPALCHLDGLSRRRRLPALPGRGRGHRPSSCPACVTAGRGGHGRPHRTPSGCATTAGMIVELLFAERNHVCSVCVANGHCELQDLGYAVGHGPRPLRVPVARAARSTPRHERFGIDHNRCVLCTRCVRVCDEIEGAHTWDVAGRGSASRRSSPTSNQPWGESRDLHRAAASACRSARPARSSRRSGPWPRW